MPLLVAEVFDRSAPALRARMLECLLRPLRPLGLAAVAAGAFSCFLDRDHWTQFSVPPEVAVRFTSEQIFELAHFVGQVRPETFGQLAALVADSTMPTGALGNSVLPALRHGVPDGGTDRP